MQISECRLQKQNPWQRQFSMINETRVILNWMWAALGVYWLWNARRSGSSVTREASWWRVMRLGTLTLTFILLLSPWLRMGWLGWRFVPNTRVARALGVAITAAGIGLCVWARVHLGKYWSDKVVLKVEHRLIRSGPYRYLRHPIYSGVLLGIIGTAVAIGEWRGIVALVLMSTNYFVKAQREERVLAGQFGEEYRDYQKQAGFLAPRL